MSYFNDFRFADDAITKSISGSLRVGQLTTLHDGKTLNSDVADIWSNVGTGTATFSGNKTTLSVAAGQYMIRQTKHYTPYFAGKPQVIEETFDGFQAQPGVTKRVGYFSSSPTAPYDANKDGFWLEDDGTTKRIIVQRKGVETVNISFTEWDNYLVLQSYAWVNFTVIFWDFLWLGGAGIRLWVATSEGWVVAHCVKYAGLQQDVVCISPSQPLRYEIRSSTGAGSLRYICSQAATEGSVDESGRAVSIHHRTDATVACNAVGSIYVLMGVRLLASHRDCSIKLTGMGCINAGTADHGVLMILKNPTITGGTLTYVPSETGTFEVALNTSSALLVTPGTGRELTATPVSENGTAVPFDREFLSYLSISLQDVPEEYVLAYSPLTINQSVCGMLSLKQF